MRQASDVTNLLVEWSDGDADAVERLIPLVYQELHAMAERHMRRERDGHTLQATALVSEAYLRLVDQTRVQWRDRAHFFAVSSQIMRRILVDHARRHRSKKRIGRSQTVSLDETVAIASGQEEEVIAIHEALEALTEIDPQTRPRGRTAIFRWSEP